MNACEGCVCVCVRVLCLCVFYVIVHTYVCGWERIEEVCGLTQAIHNGTKGVDTFMTRKSTADYPN